MAVGLTQEQLGFALGVTKSSVSAWENGRETPGFRLLPALRSTLNRSLDELISGMPPDTGLAAGGGEAGLAARNEKERALLLRYRALPASRRLAVLELIKPWSDP